MTSSDAHDAERAFGRLYEAHRRALFGFLLGRAGDREAARDLFQETFLRAWRHRDAWDGRPPHEQVAWLFAVARNLVVDAHRARAAGDAARLVLRGAVSVTAPAAEEPAARAELAERLARVERAIRGLPEPMRVVLALRVVGELTSGQAGELLGEPAGTVRYRLSEARRRPVRALEHEEDA